MFLSDFIATCCSLLCAFRDTIWDLAQPVLWVKKRGRGRQKIGEKNSPQLESYFLLLALSDFRTAVVPFGCHVCSQVICNPPKNNKKVLNSTPSFQNFTGYMEFFLQYLQLNEDPALPLQMCLSEKRAVTQPNYPSLLYDL